MDKLGPMLTNMLEQQARPLIQSKITEQFDSTKSEVKSGLPSTIMNFLTGNDGGGSGNPLLSQLVTQLGPKFSDQVSSITGSTVDTASEGMDSFMTNGVMDIAKNVLFKKASESGAAGPGGFNLDFLSSGQDGMVNSTLEAARPMIQQASGSMGSKFTSMLPSAIGGAIQQMVDKNGNAGNGGLGMAAGLATKFLGGSGGNNASGAMGGMGGGMIQGVIEKVLGPKITTLIQPFLQKFETQMMASLEKELRNKIFSGDNMKSVLMGMMGGQGGSSGVIGGAMSALMGGNSQSGSGSALGSLGNMAGSLLKNKA